VLLHADYKTILCAKFVHIKPALLELSENVSGVQLFKTQCIIKTSLDKIEKKVKK